MARAQGLAGVLKAQRGGSLCQAVWTGLSFLISPEDSLEMAAETLVSSDSVPDSHMELSD